MTGPILKRKKQPADVPDPALTDRCIAALAQGDLSALEPLYDAVSGAVYGYALSILKNAHDAEDVLQDCFLGLCRSAAEYRSQGKPLAWIFTITRNLCLQKLRERSRAAELPPEDWGESLGYTELTPELRLLFAECMTQLSETDRQILVLHAAAGLKHREIAALLAMPLATVLSRYHRAIKRLKAFYDEQEEQS